MEASAGVVIRLGSRLVPVAPHGGVRGHELTPRRDLLELTGPAFLEVALRLGDSGDRQEQIGGRRIGNLGRAARRRCQAVVEPPVPRVEPRPEPSRSYSPALLLGLILGVRGCSS
jgi:hypothetical protein